MHLTKIPTWKLYDYSYGKIKSRKKSLGKENEKKLAQKKNEQDKKTCCNGMLFSGNRDPLSETLRGPVVISTGLDLLMTLRKICTIPSDVP